MGISLFAQLGLPILMAVGAVMAWRISKRENVRDSKPSEWKDDSLDDWRRQRDAAIEAERQARLANPGATHEGGERDAEGDVKRHQRLGG
ncbi:MAG: hypothetical protein HYX53_16385 [Chloroflexi bacterium]|nr:hypothetical protein [Chloroflexota bacterium]